MTGIVTLHALLEQIRHLEFSSRSGPASRNAWSGHGSGEVRLEKEMPDGAGRTGAEVSWDILFNEQGQFRLEGQASSITFRNRYRWRLSPDGTALSLSHERRGRDAAVFLFDLIEAPAGDGDHFISREAHLCIDDLYSATLVIVRDADDKPCGFDLDWRITGPRKDEHLAYRYRC
ncbi:MULTISPECIES: DUF6314 family protein [Cobetia]|uniref:DUF6314 family protein n=1 Tax=Cobetia TaxID=204286 RepID=UPI000986C461|nr:MULTISPECIES: DUF6314 family protein [Cobetia]POR08581.1 hypothetical protein BOH68_03020 [Cobetia sp. MM1IDA2H-1]